MFTLRDYSLLVHTISHSVCACTKTILDRVLFTHNNGDFGAISVTERTGAPNVSFSGNICSEDDMRSRIFGTFFLKFLACLTLLGFSNIQKMV